MQVQAGKTILMFSFLIKIQDSLIQNIWQSYNIYELGWLLPGNLSLITELADLLLLLYIVCPKYI